jgi:hypothetical protein
VSRITIPFVDLTAQHVLLRQKLLGAVAFCSA